jgi:hypothetical protein
MWQIWRIGAARATSINVTPTRPIARLSASRLLASRQRLAKVPVCHRRAPMSNTDDKNTPPPGEGDAVDNVETKTFQRLERLRELRIAHRDLDDVIHSLQLDLYVNEVQLRRLKKRKLQLKDQITRLESELIPDLNA